MSKLEPVGTLPKFMVLLRPNHPFAHYHAKQSLIIALTAVLMPLVWASGAWVLAWGVPVVGRMLGVMWFALVLAVLVALLFSSSIGTRMRCKGNYGLCRWWAALPNDD